ncbi:MAG TPA: sigma 54-interacting transcriptional regulator [Syntrophomonas sp.]|nr:sigma 54-interacting transcriptional regulator [Syntrophomonas sp.]
MRSYSAGNMLDVILSSFTMGIIIVDHELRIKEINPFMEKLFSVTNDKIQGKRLTTIIPGSPLTDVVRSGRENGPRFERRGGKFLLSYHYPLSQNGHSTGGFSVYSDVSQQEEAKQKLQAAVENEKELEAILGNSHDGLWIMDGQGMTLRVSKSWEDFSGTRREEVLGKSVYEIVAKGIYTDSAAIHVIEQRKPVTIIYQTKTGKKALVSATPVFGENGAIWRIISNVRDITELDQYRKELEESQKINQRFQEELKFLRSQNLDDKGIIARSQAMKDKLKIAAETAKSDVTLLLLGESGVGKDVVASFIHQVSQRSNGPFIRVNCGAIPETLMESELFGYEEGSFTGARKKGKQGMFEVANGGTLFLDEVGELPLHMQSKLLHVLQEHNMMRVGGIKPIHVDIRIVAATNQDLEQMVKKGRFRKDLYYRLNVIPIQIPPLRERIDDIVPLANYFLDKFNKKYKMNKSFSPEALQSFTKYEWPGNVRELENIMERLVLTCTEDSIGKDVLPSFMEEEAVQTYLNGLPSFEASTLHKCKDELEKNMLLWAMKRCGSTRKAASVLGVSQPTVVRLLHKYGLYEEER